MGRSGAVPLMIVCAILVGVESHCSGPLRTSSELGSG
jgi:hypothetical protein